MINHHFKYNAYENTIFRITFGNSHEIIDLALGFGELDNLYISHLEIDSQVQKYKGVYD
jgi:hypothetical protein